MSLASGLRTLIVDRTLPYRVEQARQRALCAVGLRETTMHVLGLTFRVRRLTTDVTFVHKVVEEREYLPDDITLGPADTIVDIGGNIGTFALSVFRSVPVGRVISIEPDAENLRLLRHNVALNEATNVVVLPYAVTATNGPVDFSEADEGGYHTIVRERFAGAKRIRRVEGRTLEDIFKDFDIDHCHLLKIDCEGAEHEFLPTLKPALLARIDQIAMEYHPPGRIEDTLVGLRSSFEVIRDVPFGNGGGHMWLRQKR